MVVGAVSWTTRGVALAEPLARVLATGYTVLLSAWEACWPSEKRPCAMIAPVVTASWFEALLGLVNSQAGVEPARDTALQRGPVWWRGEKLLAFAQIMARQSVNYAHRGYCERPWG